MVETILLGIASYVGTNIDDLFVITFFFVGLQGRQGGWKILVGQYLGLGAIVAISLGAALGLQILPHEYICLLGLVPIGLGIKEILSVQNGNDDDDSVSQDDTKALALQVAVTSMANGADNIGVYIPLFASLEIWQVVVVLAVFAVCVVLLWSLSRRIADMSWLKQFLQRYKKILIPTVYIGLGIYILFG